MKDVIETQGPGPCESKNCKQENKVITAETESVEVRGKRYHRGCEPSPEELEAQNRSST